MALKGGDFIAKKETQEEFPVPEEVKLGASVDAKITGGYQTTAGEIFDDSDDPDQLRLVYQISLGDGQEQIERSVPWRSPAGPKTSLGKLKEMYGHFPKPGDTIRLTMGENGWRIAGLG